MQKINEQVWFITGVSSGLGRELARTVLNRGGTVVGTTRDGAAADLPAAESRLDVLPLELTNAGQVREVVANAHGLHGRLDVVVNNAGYGLLGAVEETAPEEARHVVDVNFFGPLTVMQAVLPFLRQQRHGHLVNLASIAGLAPGAGSGLYAAAKFAVEGVSQSLAQEVAPLGIKVTLVEPGAFRTGFLSSRSLRRASGRIADYEATSGQSIRDFEGMAGKQLGDPAKGAAAIVDAVLAAVPPLHLLLGSDAVRRARAMVEKLTSDVNRWEGVSLSTDFEA